MACSAAVELAQHRVLAWGQAPLEHENLAEVCAERCCLPETLTSFCPTIISLGLKSMRRIKRGEKTPTTGEGDAEGIRSGNKSVGAPVCGCGNTLLHRLPRWRSWGGLGQSLVQPITK